MLLPRPKLSPRAIATGLLCALWLAGCASRGNVDILESELREEEHAREQLAEQFRQVQEELKIARTDAAALRTQLAERRQTALSPEQADLFYRVEAIKFGMLLTSGQDRDGQPGDDALSVLLTPVDTHGDLVKLAGEIELELFDMTRSSEQQRLGQWKFSPEQVREHWHKGFMSAGYLFQVDWQTPPTAPDLTLHARLTVPDGRQFDATTQVKVTPLPSVPPPNVQASRAATRDPSLKRASATRPASRAGAAPAKATVRRTTASGAPDQPQKATAPPPAIRPAAKAGHTDLPTETSDNWTEATIPRLR
jgi:outer membrane murein-binding lipoprotein Lpp